MSDTPAPYWLTAAFATARDALTGATAGLTEDGIRQHAKLLSLSPDEAEATWARRLLEHYSGGREVTFEVAFSGRSPAPLSDGPASQVPSKK